MGTTLKPGLFLWPVFRLFGGFTFPVHVGLFLGLFFGLLLGSVFGSAPSVFLIFISTFLGAVEITMRLYQILS
ncbi:MAG: hypothetical protein AB8B99_23665 [Phormidesmis sp.]